MPSPHPEIHNLSLTYTSESKQLLSICQYALALSIALTSSFDPIWQVSMVKSLNLQMDLILPIHVSSQLILNEVVLKLD